MSISVWAQTYLDFLGLEPEKPSVSALAKLTQRQVTKVPFENASAILRYERNKSGALPSPDPEELLHRWIKQEGGCLCFEATKAFNRLLRELGYESRIISGTITFPNSHEAIAVQVEDRHYIVEVGNGAPIYAPIAMDETVEVAHAGLKFQFRPDEQEGSYLQERWIDGSWQPFCRYHVNVPRDDDSLYECYSRHHIPGQSKVLSELLLVRCTLENVFVLNNYVLTVFSPDSKEKTTIRSKEELVHVLETKFHLRSQLIIDGFDGLRRLGVMTDEPLS